MGTLRLSPEKITPENRAARVIQRKWRAVGGMYVPFTSYVLEFNKNTVNKYPKAVIAYLKEIQPVGIKYNKLNPKKLLLESNDRRGKNLDIVYTRLKSMLPNTMLPKYKRINYEKYSKKLNTYTRKANIIKRSFFPVRKIIYILRKHPSLRFAAQMMSNINLAAELISGEVKKYGNHLTMNNLKNTIMRMVGPCHINTAIRNNPTINKASYLVYYRTQMILACKEIVRRKMPENEFVNKFKSALGNRPCIENLIDALSQVAFGETQWKGVNTVLNLRKAENANKLRNQIIAPYMSMHYKNVKNNGNYTKNRLWNSIKNRPLYILTNNGPGFIPVKNIRNTRKISNNAFNMYSEYLN
jgi:hypothetical protein